MAHHFPDRKEFKEQFFTLLRPEAGFYKVVLVYSLAISLLTLAVPLSVQLLVDTVANIALPRAVFLIASLLFALLFFSGVMYALRTYAMELFSRKIYSRISSEMAMTAMLAESDYFEEHQQADLFNRYFDIITIKKSLPSILTNGFTFLLQAIIGFTVVSFYHFYFMLYCLALILLIWLIWRIWGWAAINTSFSLSQSKYDTASWLQSLAVTNESSHNAKPHVCNRGNRPLSERAYCLPGASLPVYLRATTEFFVSLCSRKRDTFGRWRMARYCRRIDVGSVGGS